MCAVEWKKIWQVTIWDKRFSGIDKKLQPKVIKYHYYLANDLKELERSFGDIRILYTTEQVAYTDSILVSNNISEGEIVAIPWGGNASVKYFKGKFITADNRIATSSDIATLNNKYLYYWMLHRKDELEGYYRGAGIKHPSMYSVLMMDIPIPSLAKQQEIVSHLDTFTTLISNLESELDMRRKQYEHYRNQLLDFEGVEGVEWKSLGEVCIKTENIKWKNATNDYYYIDLSSVERESNRIIEVQSICKDNAPSRAQQIVLRNDILFGTTRPTLKRLCIVPQDYDNQICSTGFCVLRANINVINHRLLYFLLTTMSFYTYVENNQEGAGYPSISNSKIMKYEVPIPSFATQQEIVSKLDAFENLIQSLEQEIKLRKQQYEYYREKLLTFE